MPKKKKLKAINSFSRDCEILSVFRRSKLQIRENFSQFLRLEQTIFIEFPSFEEQQLKKFKELNLVITSKKKETILFKNAVFDSTTYYSASRTANTSVLINFAVSSENL